MATSSFFCQSLLLRLHLFFLFCSTRIVAQSLSRGANYSCSSASPPSCHTFVAYFAQPPEFMDIGNISDLFGVSRLSIVQASNLVSEDSKLVPGQLLLVPITCGCNGTMYSSKIMYQIKAGDSYYLVSIRAFENLTNWQVVEDANPMLNPNLLPTGAEVEFPLFCKCPTKTQLEAEINLFITYVLQPADQVITVATKFNTNASDIIAENNLNNFTAAIHHPVLIPVSQLPILSQNYTSLLRRHGTNHGWLLVIVISSVCTALVILSSMFLVYTCRKPKKEKGLERNGSSLETADLIQPKGFTKFEKFMLQGAQDKLLSGVSGYLGKPIVYDMKVIMEATMDLSEHLKIGSSVYRATINGQILAIKRIKDETSEEIKILQRVNHANLVKLLGVSSDKDGNCFLVYEYVQNGSLSKWLHKRSTSSSSSNSVVLTWIQRLRIALNVANGLVYMHEHAQPSIVHGNIRMSNILLDSRFKAKISNFSLATSATDPAKLKVDIVAFGVMLLELLSGKKAVGTKENGGIGILWREITDILDDGNGKKKEERLRKWMDPSMDGVFPMEGALSLAALAKACTVENPSSRPSMAEIVFNLSVLSHSSSENLELSWASPGLEAEEVARIINPITAR